MVTKRGFFLVGLVLLTMAAGFLVVMGFFGAKNLITVIAAVLAFLVLIILAGKVKSPRLWLPVGTAAFLLLFAPTSYLAELPAGIPVEWVTLINYGLLSIMIITLVVSGLILNAGLHRLTEQEVRGPVHKFIIAAWQERKTRAGLVMIGLSLLIILKSLINFYGLMIWDGASDSLEFLWLFIPVTATLFGALALLFNMPARSRYAGIAFALVVPALFIATLIFSQQVDNRALTDSRAVKVSRAVERYHQRTGVYPQTLSQLSPLAAYTLPGPVILPGQDWCYQSNGDSYRLGYVNRDHWSSPYLSARVITEKGNGDFTDELCAAEIQALIALRPGYYSALK